MATEVESYEEVRRRKLEENKRKLEELKLGHLSLSLREATFTPKTSPAKQVRRKATQEGYTIIKRRSHRIANLPVETYKEVIPEVVQHPRKVSRCRDLSGRVYASDEARAYTIEKAGEIEDGLGAAYPSFIKPMLQSHTTGGFWLGLPIQFNIHDRSISGPLCTHIFKCSTKISAGFMTLNSSNMGLPIQFCNKHLPKRDSTIVLVDENGEESPTTYLSLKKGLSAGWRGFSINHELVDGDALVFQLIKPTTFKVYIVRARGYEENR